MLIKRFRTTLHDYKDLLATAQMQKVDMAEAVSSGKHIYNYNHSKAKYLADNMKKNVEELRKLITQLYSHSTNPVLGEQYSRIMINVRLLQEKYYDPVRSIPIIEQIERMLKPLEQDEFIRQELEEFHAAEKAQQEKAEKEEIESVVEQKPEKVHVQIDTGSAELEVTDIPEIKLPFLPVEIAGHIVEDVNELERCYNNSCYRSAVILCGRILETALHRKYFEVTGNDILETNPGVGLGKLIAKLNEHDVSFDPGLMNQVHLVNNVRIGSVHVKKDLYRPNQNQTQAIILYTLDALHKMFSK